MASNIPYGGWSVKMVSIPAFITITQLAQTIGLPKSRIYLRKVKNNNTLYAWIEDFGNEEEASKFARQWSGSSNFGETIECLVVTSKDDETNVLHSSRDSLVSEIETLPNTQHESRSTRGATGRRDSSNPLTKSVSLTSIITNGMPDTAMDDDDDDEKKSMKLLPYHFHRSLNLLQQRPTSNQVSQQEEIFGKSSYAYH